MGSARSFLTCKVFEIKFPPAFTSRFLIFKSKSTSSLCILERERESIPCFSELYKQHATNQKPFSYHCFVFVIPFRWDLTPSKYIQSEPKWAFPSFNSIHVLKTKTRISPSFLCFAEMKRTRDDIIPAPASASASQFKRPLTSTRGES